MHLRSKLYNFYKQTEFVEKRRLYTCVKMHPYMTHTHTHINLHKWLFSLAFNMRNNFIVY